MFLPLRGKAAYSFEKGTVQTRPALEETHLHETVTTRHTHTTTSDPAEAELLENSCLGKTRLKHLQRCYSYKQPEGSQQASNNKINGLESKNLMYKLSKFPRLADSRCNDSTGA